MLVLQRDLVGDTLKLCSHLSGTLIEVFRQSVQVLHVSHLLLLLLNFERANILFKLPLYYSMVILGILKGDLGLLLQLSELVEVLEYQVLDALLVDLDLYLVLFVQVL